MLIVTKVVENTTYYFFFSYSNTCKFKKSFLFDKYKGSPKKNEPVSDTKKIPIVAISQAVEQVVWLILHCRYNVYVVLSLCCL